MAKSPAAATFGSILDRAPSEIEKPKPAPVGSYITAIVGQPRYDKSSKKQTEFVEFTHKFISAGDDVDADELEAFLGDRKLSEITIKNTYYLTEASLWRVKEFLEHAGVNLDDMESLREGIEATAGAQVGLFINHEPSQDGTSVFARVGKTFVVE
jgi:hypothetical protein